MRPRKRERNELLVRSYELGAGLNDLVKDFGLCYTSVRDVIVQAEHERGKSILRPRGRPTDIPPPRSEYFKKYWEKNSTELKLARKLHIDVAEARKYFK